MVKKPFLRGFYGNEETLFSHATGRKKSVEYPMIGYFVAGTLVARASIWGKLKKGILGPITTEYCHNIARASQYLHFHS